MSWWEKHVVPRLVEAALSSGRVHRERAQTCRGLRGRVLEVGFGSGLNLSHLPDTVDSLDAVEPSDTGWMMSRERRSTASLPVHRVGLDGQSLAAESATYDAALCTFTLCTIPDPASALAELRRVLRPGARLHLLEHGLSPDPGVARWQRRLDPVERLVAGGCHLSRDPDALVRATGFEVLDSEQRYLPGPRLGRPWTYGYQVVAQVP